MRAYRKRTPVSRRVKRWVRFDIALIAAGIAVLVVGFARNSSVTYTIGSASTEPQAGPKAAGVTHPKSFNLAVSVGSQIADSSGVRVSSLETEDGSESAVGGAEPFGAGAPCAFDERFYFDRQLASFDERFASAFGSPGDAAGKAGEAGENNMLLGKRDPAVPRSAAAPATASRLASLPGERLNTLEAPGLSLPLDPDSRTAIYDIAARTVYLPNGHRLEAHSGLGNRLDDPRYVNTKGQGPTPPNIYNLALRERLFHGVRAIRLIPADDGKMFGRDGILAHSYMLGPSGQSNGCVSFRNYPAFLTAFLKGEVDRLVVVEHLATKAGAKISAANGS
jgi:hypothetical protein